MYAKFTRTVWDYYQTQKRDLPWRDILQDSDAERSYKVLVSELMLQQTQVGRVIDKYSQWMERWPTNAVYQQANLADTLVEWSGLGYNRRAKYLHQSLHILHSNYNDVLPKNSAKLISFPGIGINTANAMLAYVHNMPVSFIETNIRTVYIHHFYNNTTAVTDSNILELVNKTVDKNNPREWYWALMDYGTYLKKEHPSVLHLSKQHKKQKPFQGSVRQIRGLVIKQLALTQSITETLLAQHINDPRLGNVLEDLTTEGLVTYDVTTKMYTLAS